MHKLTIKNQNQISFFLNEFKSVWVNRSAPKTDPSEGYRPSWKTMKFCHSEQSEESLFRTWHVPALTNQFPKGDSSVASLCQNDKWSLLINKPKLLLNFAPPYHFLLDTRLNRVLKTVLTLRVSE